LDWEALKTLGKENDMEKEELEEVVDSPTIPKGKREKPSKGTQQMATTKKENLSKQSHFLRTLEQLTSIVATYVMVTQVPK